MRWEYEEGLLGRSGRMMRECEKGEEGGWEGESVRRPGFTVIVAVSL